MKWLELPQILWLIIPIVAGLLSGVILALVVYKKNQAKGLDLLSDSIRFTNTSWLTYSALGLFIFCAFALAFTLNIFYSPLPANTGAIAMDSKAGENMTIPNISGSPLKSQPEPTAESKQLPGNEALPPTSVSTTATIIPTSFESERYVNNEYGFALRYPKKYIAGTASSPTCIFYVYDEDTRSTLSYSDVVYVDVRSSTSPRDAAIALVKELISRVGAGVIPDIESDGVVTLADGKTQVTAITFSVLFGQAKAYCIAFKNSNDGKFITVFCGANSKKMELYKEIGQTLEFTQVKQPNLQTEPKQLSFESTTYTDKENGFSIQYPKNWIRNAFYAAYSSIVYAASPPLIATPVLIVDRVDSDIVVEEHLYSLVEKAGGSMVHIRPGQHITLQDGLDAQLYTGELHSSRSGQLKALVLFIKGSRSFCIIIIDKTDNYEEAKCMEILSTFRLVK